MDEQGFDSDIRDVLDETFQAALKIGSDHTPDQLKLMIIATNLEALAKTFLLADDHEEVTLDLKQVALGLLGSKDWLSEGFED